MAEKKNNIEMGKGQRSTVSAVRGTCCQHPFHNKSHKEIETVTRSCWHAAPEMEKGAGRHMAVGMGFLGALEVLGARGGTSGT